MGAAVVVVLFMFAIVAVMNVIISRVVKKNPQFPKMRTIGWTILGAVFSFFALGNFFQLGYYFSIWGVQNIDFFSSYLPVGIVCLALGITLFGAGIKIIDKPMVAAGSGLLGFACIALLFAIMTR